MKANSLLLFKLCSEFQWKKYLVVEGPYRIWTGDLQDCSLLLYHWAKDPALLKSKITKHYSWGFFLFAEQPNSALFGRLGINLCFCGLASRWIICREKILFLRWQVAARKPHSTSPKGSKNPQSNLTTRAGDPWQRDTYDLSVSHPPKFHRGEGGHTLSNRNRLLQSLKAFPSHFLHIEKEQKFITDFPKSKKGKKKKGIV